MAYSTALSNITEPQRSLGKFTVWVKKSSILKYSAFLSKLLLTLPAPIPEEEKKLT